MLRLVTIADPDEKLPDVGKWHNNFKETTIFIERVIAYWSRLMKQNERNYSVTEKEALAVRDALVKFTHILEGKRNTIITDHSALTWATMFADKIKAKPRLSKWNLVFSAFDHKWVHRAGRVHSNVDPLS